MSSKVVPAGEGEESFQPKFDGQGLLTAVAVEIDSGQVLMVAFMNAEAVEMLSLIHISEPTRPY